MKTCTKCKETKPFSEYYRGKREKDGLQFRCKDCCAINGTYSLMHNRCYNKRDRAYKYYGGRGITVCEEWHDKETFFAWLLANKWKRGMWIGRININGDYEPKNIRITTAKVCVRNRRAMLTEKQVSGIKYLLTTSIPHGKIAEMCGTSRSRVSSINLGYAWSDVPAATIR